MNISACNNSFQMFRRMSRPCIGYKMLRSLFNRPISVTSVLYYTTPSSPKTTMSPQKLGFKLFPLLDKNRFITTAKDKCLHLAAPFVCNRFYSTKSQASPKNAKAPAAPPQGGGAGAPAPHKHAAALSAKIRKKISAARPVDKSGLSEVVAYAISEEIYLESLDIFLSSQKLYKKQPLPPDVEDAIHVNALYEVDYGLREVFFFREGAVVFWNMSYLERKEILHQVRKFCSAPYDFELSLNENESLNFCYTDKKPQTSITGYKIQFSELLNTETHNLEKYTFSNALGLSVKLSLWEESLVQFVDSIEPLIDDLRCGRKIRITRENLLRKTGELFTLRHLVNLSSDLLDTPDFYWDREGLEPLYQNTINYLNVAKRTRVMNEKLKHCCELIELLSHHLNDQHHTRLELMIIILIMVEVMFEIIHYIEKYYPGADAEILIPIIDK